MMKVLVTYQSKTGFTRKYAEWISQEFSCDMKEISTVTPAEVAGCDIVIHGGWIMGGMINGLDKIKSFSPVKLIVFGVGFTKKCDMEIAKCIEANKLDNIPFFYYEGGMNPKKMGFLGRMMVKMVTKKPLVFSDNTDKNEITELVEEVNKFGLGEKHAEQSTCHY